MTSPLSGQLLYFFVLTLVVSLACAALVLWHYARRVRAGMRDSGVPVPVPPAARHTPTPTPTPAAAGDPTPWLAFDRRFERRLLAAWVASALLAALPVAAVWIAASDAPVTLSRTALLATVLAQLAWPVLALSRGWQWARTVQVAAAGMLASALLTTLLSIADRLLRGAAPTADQWLNLLVWFQLAGALLAPVGALLLLSTPRRIRQVVPMLFGALVLFALAPFMGARAFDALLAQEAAVGLLASAGGVQLRHAVFVALALPAGWLVARRLRALAAAHQAKAFSDMQLLARAWWLMLVGAQVMGLVASDTTPWWGAPACALAGLAFLPVQRWVFRVLPPAAGAPPARTLLFLRAFGHQARTERLFDRLGARWRALGPILLIAAPDVVARSMDPADLLAWLQGREAQAFVRDGDGLAARLAAIDSARDPDGLHRLNEFCCTASTWQATVVALMHRADAVLMDLRAVPVGSAAGCAWELGQLAQRLPARRVVLVVDGDTALAPLQAALGPAAAQVVWQRMDRERPADLAVLHLALVHAAA
jgi:hypothetical protein